MTTRKVMLRKPVALPLTDFAQVAVGVWSGARLSSAV